MVLRIASLSIPANVNLAIAASVFVAAGVLILYIINLLFAQRILRSLHPRFGWHLAVSVIFRVLYALVAFTLVIVITATVQSFFTLKPRTRTIDRDLQLYGSTFLMLISFLPILIVGGSLVIPRKSVPEKFGQGRHRSKTITLLVGTILCCLGAAFRCGTSWKHPVPLTQPRPAYYSKACFYIFNFTVEIVVVYLYGIMRVDRRFWVPNGAKGQGSYAAGISSATTIGDDKVKGAGSGTGDNFTSSKAQHSTV
jgi:MFS family permease